MSKSKYLLESRVPPGDEPSGFALHEADVFTPGRGRERETARVELLVPTNRLDELKIAEREKHAKRLAAIRACEDEEYQEMEKRRAEERAEKAARELLGGAEPVTDNSQLDLKRLPPAGALTGKIDTAKPPRALDAVVAGKHYLPANEHPVFAPSAPAEMYTRASVLAGDKEIKKRDLEMSHRLAGSGLLRLVAAPERIDALDPLYASYPNFKEVIDLVRDQLMLAMKSGKAPRIPPILLDGEPGLGKTHFANALGKVLGAPVKRISFDASITASRLVGTDRHWSNTTVGNLFEEICLGRYANPVFILDEVDKSSNKSYQNPVAALHSLLEPSTAAHTRDLSADMEFDAGLVTWIATSNYAQLLLPSLRSRFREFRIQRPDAAGAISSARMVIASVFESMGLDDFQEPGRELAVALAHFVPREVQQAAQQAIANAVAGGRNFVTAADIPARFRDDESADPKNWLH